MKKDEALKLALEVIEAIHTVGDVACVVTPNGTIYLRPTITAIKEALTIEIAAGPQAFYGFPHGSVSALNASGKCVTDGETSPPKEIDPNKWAFDNGLEST
jgi:hypothetical protein